eukprot:7680878-Pyramimonas_sp.AAC.1
MLRLLATAVCASGSAINWIRSQLRFDAGFVGGVSRHVSFPAPRRNDRPRIIGLRAASQGLH